MKIKNIVPLLLIVLATYSVQAQTKGFHFGLHCSPNISWIKPDVEEIVYKSDGVKMGVAYGAIFEYNFTPNVGINTGINVIHTGGHLTYPSVPGDPVGDTGTLWRNYSLQYVEIPFLIKGSTGDLLGNFSFFGRFGVGSAINIKAKADDEYLSDSNPGGTPTLVENKNVNKDVSFWRESLIIGVGSEYRLGKSAIIQAGLTFSNGFTDILTQNASIKPIIKEKARSNFVELNVGILFTF